MILVTGGSGFIGRHLVARLVAEGENVRIAARGERSSALPDSIEQVQADVVTGNGLREAMEGVDRIAHLVAIIVERGAQRFDAVIRGGTQNVVAAAKETGVRKLLYVSAIGAAPDPKFPYWQAKWQAEQSLIESELNYTILRPSLVFGPEDDFFNRLAHLVRQMPVTPIAGNGKTEFQPIWVEDVATCIIACLREGSHDGEILEIGGPDQMTYNELIDVVGNELGIKRPKVHVPLALMRPGARLLQSLLSNPPVTTDQLAMLAKDNTTEVDAVQRQFGFTPKSLRGGLSYLSVGAKAAS